MLLSVPLDAPVVTCVVDIPLLFPESNFELTLVTPAVYVAPKAKEKRFLSWLFKRTITGRTRSITTATNIYTSVLFFCFDDFRLTVFTNFFVTFFMY
jgi:hypothetical protein